MKTNKMAKLLVVPALLITLTACSENQGGNREVIKEPGKTITVIDDAGKNASEPDVSISKIEPYKDMAISDWLDGETIIVSKENEELGKMSLAELADSYPRSLYLYDVNTKEYKLLLAKENANLGSGGLSPDKKHLIYSEFSLGDPIYYVMNLETRDSFPLTGEAIAGAMSAHWADDGSVIGAAYSGGAFRAGTDGKIAALDGLAGGDGLVIVQQMKDKVYYTGVDAALQVLDLATQEKKAFEGLDNLGGLYPSPDGNQLLAIQYNGEAKVSLILSDADGTNRKTVADGAELGGVSWSPDQRMIAFSLKADVNGASVNGLYVYDLLTGKTTRIAVDIGNATTAWSPSGEQLSYTEWKDNKIGSSIVHLAYSLK